MYYAIATKSIEAVGLSRDEWEDLKKKLPEYLSQGMTFPLFTRDEKGRLMLFDIGFLWPGIGDIYDLLRDNFNILAQTVVADLYHILHSGETREGYRVFFDHESPTMKAIKTVGYLAQATWPLLRDLSHAYDMLVGKEDAFTPTEFILRQLGFVTYPKHEHQVYRAHAYRMREKEGEISRWVSREIQRGADPYKVAEEAWKRYMELRQ
jgi:hypothetical protein